MHVWYRAVCDEHKEMCDMFVNNPIRTSELLGDRGGEIRRWLDTHYACSLRLVHHDLITDAMWDEYKDELRKY